MILASRFATNNTFAERYHQIDYENRILLKKMSDIMRTHSLDNINPNAGRVKSLNADLRKRELRKIMDENRVRDLFMLHALS